MFVIETMNGRVQVSTSESVVSWSIFRESAGT